MRTVRSAPRSRAGTPARAALPRRCTGSALAVLQHRPACWHTTRSQNTLDAWTKNTHTYTYTHLDISRACLTSHRLQLALQRRAVHVQTSAHTHTHAHTNTHTHKHTQTHTHRNTYINNRRGTRAVMAHRPNLLATAAHLYTSSSCCSTPFLSNSSEIVRWYSYAPSSRGTAHNPQIFVPLSLSQQLHSHVMHCLAPRFLTPADGSVPSLLRV